MKLGIGIDTGGTYTDAVLYDIAHKKVIDSAKSLTTKQDLSIGISKVLDHFKPEMMDTVGIISLSTTLATNACVEDKGGRGKLLFIGIDEKIVNRVGHKYGLKNEGEIYYLPNKSLFDGTYIETPDWDALLANTTEWLSDADGLAIVEINAMHTGAMLEKEAKALFTDRYDIPVVCGHELSSKLNSIQRGATALLNVRLISIINEFIDAMKVSLDDHNIEAPMVIVRSDGSLMSDTFSLTKPVDTILSGPAASVLGGVILANEPNSIIVDIGGTTTDVSLVKNGSPKLVDSGINIGGWKTHVDGVFVDTFGLGGDSAIRIKDGKIHLETRKIMPISQAAHQWPSILDELRTLLQSNRIHDYPIHEFFHLVKEIDDTSKYTPVEIKLCNALKDKPLSLEDTASALGTSIYELDVETLEKEGIILRCGLTPTDIMHLKGDFEIFDTEGARLTAEYLRRCINEYADYTPEQFNQGVYNEVKKKLFTNLVRILLQEKNEHWTHSDLEGQLGKLIEHTWQAYAAGDEPSYFDSHFTTSATFIGIGAPTHVFLPDVAKALGTTCVIPDHAAVANAIGAISSNVHVHTTIEIKANYSPAGITDYTVYGLDKNMNFNGLEEATEEATHQAKSFARKEAKRRGARGSIIVKSEAVEDAFRSADGTSLNLGTHITATATGSIGY